MAVIVPLINYAGYEHVLNAVPCFMHPNGNKYGIAVEKVGGITQNLSVYRVRPGSTARELVHLYVGGVDSQAQIAAGGCWILPDGSLEVWASAVPPGPYITKTGFVGGAWPPIPNVDDPYNPAGGQKGDPGLPGPKGDSTWEMFDDAPITNPAWEARSLTSGVDLDIPATFGVPSAKKYLLRLTANAPLPNVRGRVGTRAKPFIFTVNTQAPNVDMMQQGWVPGPVCYVSPAQGTPKIWLQIIGMG